MGDEKIVCFEKEILNRYEIKDSIFYNKEFWGEVTENLKVFPRSKIEKDYSYKQIIVYVVIKSQNNYLVYHRSPATGEKRLSNMYSLGIGGHVNSDDVSQLHLINERAINNFFLKAVMREINEEITINSQIIDEPKLLCFINDDSDDVGKVHFGVVWILEISEKKVDRRFERGIGKINFFELTDLIKKENLFENWSKLLIQYFAKGGFPRVDTN